MNAVILLIIGIGTSITAITISEDDILDWDYLDRSVDPCDNFYQFACGNFAKIRPKPDNAKILDQFTLTEDELVQIGNDFLSAPKSDRDPQSFKKVKAAYRACVDVSFSDHLAVPEQQVIEEYGGMPLTGINDSKKFTWGDIGRITGKFGVHNFFRFALLKFGPQNNGLYMTPDVWEEPEMIRPRDSKTYDEIVEESLRSIAREPSLRPWNLKASSFDTFIRNISEKIIGKVNPGRLQEQHAISKDLGEIKSFMSQLFSGGIVDEDMLPLQYVPATLRQLQNWTDYQFHGEVDLNWVEYFQGIFDGSGFNVTEDLEVYYLGISSIYGILNLVRKTDPDIVKNFVLLRTFLFLAPDSDSITRAAFLDYYKTNDIRHYNRLDYCTRKILDVVDSISLSFAASYGYGRYHFNYNKIRKGVELIGKVKSGFVANVERSGWVDEESRGAILRKIDNIVISLAYPELVNETTSLDRFYDKLRICEWDHYGNAQRIRSFKRAHIFSEFVDPDFWGVAPFEVNAYFLRTDNRIMFPISMLGERFFDGNNLILDYSRLVNAIAHELTHSVDSSGISYNENGLMSPLLSATTLETFNTKTRCLVEQYNGYHVEEVDAYVDGANTLNENLADNAAVKQTFNLFTQVVQDEHVQNRSKHYTLEQLFFISYATGWCTQESVDYLKTFMSNSPRYPPTRYRVIGPLANLAEFSEAFGCPVGSNMNPSSKCIVW